MHDHQLKVITEAEQWIQSLLEKESTGHDMYHINRVRSVARQIAQEEGANLFLVDLMALFHELPDEKLRLFSTTETAYQEMRQWLLEHNLTDNEIDEIENVISRQSYSHSGVRGEVLDSLAGRVVQDADRLDGFGAIGIARCFAYGGKKGRPIYDPAIPFRETITPENYRDCPTSLHHFTEKLLKLRDSMNTATSKRLAEERHQITQQFFDRFLAEWEGEA